MSTYVVGDIQGCCDEFRRLLDLVRFDPAADTLWQVGDLINRGPDNAGVMDIVMELPDAVIVLGNHDLHFLAVEAGIKTASRSDTLADLLASPRREDYVSFLRNLPLLHTDLAAGIVMVHAGLPPQLSIDTCVELAHEVEQQLRSDTVHAFLSGMYGNEPARFDDSLTGAERLRVITNGFTRLRYCKADGEMELTHKADIQPDGYAPWFSFPRPDDLTILFGHWAALQGTTSDPRFVALDTGCVWGRQLTALRLDDRQIFHVEASR